MVMVKPFVQKRLYYRCHYISSSSNVRNRRQNDYKESSSRHSRVANFATRKLTHKLSARNKGSFLYVSQLSALDILQQFDEQAKILQLFRGSSPRFQCAGAPLPFFLRNVVFNASLSLLLLQHLLFSDSITFLTGSPASVQAVACAPSHAQTFSPALSFCNRRTEVPKVDQPGKRLTAVLHFSNPDYVCTSHTGPLTPNASVVYLQALPSPTRIWPVTPRTITSVVLSREHPPFPLQIRLLMTTPVSAGCMFHTDLQWQEQFHHCLLIRSADSTQLDFSRSWSLSTEAAAQRLAESSSVFANESSRATHKPRTPTTRAAPAAFPVRTTAVAPASRAPAAEAAVTPKLGASATATAALTETLTKTPVISERASATSHTVPANLCTEHKKITTPRRARAASKRIPVTSRGAVTTRRRAERAVKSAKGRATTAAGEVLTAVASPITQTVARPALNSLPAPLSSHVHRSASGPAGVFLFSVPLCSLINDCSSSRVLPAAVLPSTQHCPPTRADDGSLRNCSKALSWVASTVSLIEDARLCCTSSSPPEKPQKNLDASFYPYRSEPVRKPNNLVSSRNFSQAHRRSVSLFPADSCCVLMPAVGKNLCRPSPSFFHSSGPQKHSDFLLNQQLCEEDALLSRSGWFFVLKAAPCTPAACTRSAEFAFLSSWFVSAKSRLCMGLAKIPLSSTVSATSSEGPTSGPPWSFESCQPLQRKRLKIQDFLDTGLKGGVSSLLQTQWSPRNIRQKRNVFTSRKHSTSQSVLLLLPPIQRLRTPQPPQKQRKIMQEGGLEIHCLRGCILIKDNLLKLVLGFASPYLPVSSSRKLLLSEFHRQTITSTNCSSSSYRVNSKKDTHCSSFKSSGCCFNTLRLLGNLPVVGKTRCRGYSSKGHPMGIKTINISTRCSTKSTTKSRQTFGIERATMNRTGRSSSTNSALQAAVPLSFEDFQRAHTWVEKLISDQFIKVQQEVSPLNQPPRAGPSKTWEMLEDGGVLKRQIMGGEGSVYPSLSSNVTIEFSLHTLSGEKLTDHRAFNMTMMEFPLANALPGVQTALKSMRKLERSVFLLSPENGLPADFEVFLSPEMSGEKETFAETARTNVVSGRNIDPQHGLGNGAVKDEKRNRWISSNPETAEIKDLSHIQSEATTSAIGKICVKGGHWLAFDITMCNIYDKHEKWWRLCPGMQFIKDIPQEDIPSNITHEEWLEQKADQLRDKIQDEMSTNPHSHYWDDIEPAMTDAQKQRVDTYTNKLYGRNRPADPRNDGSRGFRDFVLKRSGGLRHGYEMGDRMMGCSRFYIWRESPFSFEIMLFVKEGIRSEHVTWAITSRRLDFFFAGNKVFGDEFPHPIDHEEGAAWTITEAALQFPAIDSSLLKKLYDAVPLEKPVLTNLVDTRTPGGAGSLAAHTANSPSHGGKPPLQSYAHPGLLVTALKDENVDDLKFPLDRPALHIMLPKAESWRHMWGNPFKFI